MATPDSKRRWFHLTPDRFVVGLLLTVRLLWLSERYQWFGFNHHKGWTVLIAVAAVGIALILMLLWLAASVILRWRFQFGIRSLLALVVVRSIVGSWLAAAMRQAGEQRRAVGELVRLGGSQSYDCDFDSSGNMINYEFDKSGNWIPGAYPPGPEWLRNALGDDFFINVVGVSLTSNELTDAGLVNLRGLTHLKSLDLGRTKITDRGLENLQRLDELHELRLNDTKLTDAGLVNLEGLKQLQELWLNNTRITDAGIEKLHHALPGCDIGH